MAILLLLPQRYGGSWERGFSATGSWLKEAREEDLSSKSQKPVWWRAAFILLAKPLPRNPIGLEIYDNRKYKNRL